jgi:Putative prokaryotic signal transducing protein
VSEEVVVLRTYVSELEARLAATILEANGIAAEVLADNAGGAYPSMALVYPIRLLVRAEDAALAAEILDTPAEEPATDDTPADDTTAT